MNKKLPCYKQNTVKNCKLFNETLVSAYFAMTSPHQVKYLSMTGAQHHPGGHHATLFVNEILYVSFWKKVVHKHMYFQISSVFIYIFRLAKYISCRSQQWIRTEISISKIRRTASQL